MQFDYSVQTVPAFDGENYHLWAVRMEAFLDANDLWKVAEEDYEVGQLLENPTLNQIKYHKERKQQKSKAKSCLFFVVSQSIFTRIVTLKSAQAIWDFL
uniref:Uncharacterized protein n=1 Tax=Cajanus cajan TaxID=3821 RepID=A0A151QSW9_CAJCA|nr:hypothetical protein KK1_045784 [Cajanus cajan]